MTGLEEAWKICDQVGAAWREKYDLVEAGRYAALKAKADLRRQYEVLVTRENELRERASELHAQLTEAIELLEGVLKKESGQ